MSIHSRRAVDDVLDFLAKAPDAGVPVLHWFSGTGRQLDRAVALGCWFSVGPAMLRSKRGAELAAAMPKGRVLTETDGPFGISNGKPLEPLDVLGAIEGLAALWGEDSETVRSRMSESLRSLIALVEVPHRPSKPTW